MCIDHPILTKTIDFHLINSKMVSMNLKRIKNTVNNSINDQNDVLKIVVTDGATELALTFLNRILYDTVFGKDQLVFISIFEFKDKALLLETVEIELTSFSPSNLHGKFQNAKNSKIPRIQGI